MYSAKKYVVLADIESVRISYATFAKALNELSNFGEIAACKFYGYSSKRTKDYDEFIRENNFDALSALPKKKRGRLDLRQVIDAVRLAQFPNIDGFFLIYGQGDITPLIAYLKSYGMDVIAGVLEPDKNSALCNKVILLGGEEPIVKDVLKKGYKQVAPTELIFVDNEPENVVDEKVIEKALNEVIPQEEVKEEPPTAEEEKKLEDETMAQIDKMIEEVNSEVNSEQNEDEPKAEEATEEAAESVNSNGGDEDKDENKDNQDLAEEEIENLAAADDVCEDATADEDYYFNNDGEQEDEQEDEHESTQDDVDDDELIAQLYKLLGGLDD